MTDAPVSNPPAEEPVKTKRTLGCFSIFAIITLILILLFAIAVAKTGVIKIPILSWFYSGPKPVRAIGAKAIDTEAFRSLVISRVFKQALVQKPPYKITLNESELTGAIKSAIETMLKEQGLTSSNSQLAITPEGFEYYGSISKDERKVDLLLRLTPTIENGGLRLDPSYLRVGDYPIKPEYIISLAEMLFGQKVGKNFVFSSDDIRLEAIGLRTGLLDLTVSQRKP